MHGRFSRRNWTRELEQFCSAERDNIRPARASPKIWDGDKASSTYVRFMYTPLLPPSFTPFNCVYRRRLHQRKTSRQASAAYKAIPDTTQYILHPHLENNPLSEGRSCGGGDDDGPGSAAAADVEGSSAQARICCRTCRPLLRLREDSPEMPTGTKRNTIHAVQRNAMDAKRDKLKTGLVLANTT